MAYLHPDKQDSVRRVLVKTKARKAPKPKAKPAPSPDLIANLAMELFARSPAASVGEQVRRGANRFRRPDRSRRRRDGGPQPNTRHS